MIYAIVIILTACGSFAMFCRWLFTKPVKPFYSIVKETDIKDKEIYKVYIGNKSGGLNYLGKFNTLADAKKKIVALKEKATKAAEDVFESISKTEVYHEDI